MQINRIDVIWNYAATFLKVAASALLLPFILRMMSAETVGIWSVFMAITSLINLLDFGFNPAFTRNVTYVFSGVKFLKIQGFAAVENADFNVDYGLLKGVIDAMRWFYLRGAVLLLLILASLGTYYIHSLLQSYHGSHWEVYMAWALLCIINTYNLFTLYYDSLLQGKGLIKRSKQIVIAGQLIYLIVATILILSGKGLVALVAAQAFSVVIIRALSYRSFFTIEIKNAINDAAAQPKAEILKAVYPNAVKVGLTVLGGVMVQRSAIVIGSLYLPLESIASYGITLQLIAVIAGIAATYSATYQSKIVQLRVENNMQLIKKLYIKGQGILFGTFLIGGLGLVFFGNWMLAFMGSQTKLLDEGIIGLAMIVFCLDSHHSIAGNMILTKNEVPFFKAALLSGIATIILLLLFFNFTGLGIVSMIAAPGIAQGVYQNWKWPLVVKRELGIRFSDLFKVVR